MHGGCSPLSAETLSCASCPNDAHVAGREPVIPGLLDTVSDVRAVMEVQVEGMVPVRPVSDVLKEARWVRVDQEEGSGPVRGFDEMFSWVSEVKVDQAGGREPTMPLLLKSRDCRAVSIK